MTCSENYWSSVFLICNTTNCHIPLHNQLRHFRLEMHFTTTIDDGVSHRLYHLRQSVCSNMRMGISKDSRRSPMLTKHVEDFVRITTFLASCIELTIRIGTSPTLSETVVTFSIYLLRLGNQSQVLFPLVYVLTSFQYNGAQSEFYQPEGCKQTSRTSTHHNHLGTSFHIRINYPLIFIIMWLFVDICPYFQVYVYLSLAGIDATFQDAYAINCPYVKAIFLSQISFQFVLLRCHLWHDTYLVFIRHFCLVF